ncbi:transposase [uncultured Ellagibacter sp.]|uniref:transposase n=1 Tax=uncultured Ellagibacter sp. TaxID=2137580 RepID=UPI0025F746AD|nr:transposase [uncultured Ellagibacter sp.]
MATPKFKPCMQHQPMLFPPSVEELIPEGALVRVVDSIVDGMDRSVLESAYPGGGASAHDPSMMLKVVLFCYASGIYSSRKIAAATRENVNLMWLTGMRPLDHNTVNRFRSERIRPVFEDVFSEVVAVLADAGHITLDTYFLDGTKIEADANKFTFVWKKSTDRYQDALRRKVRARLEAIDEMNDEEEALAPEDPSAVDADAIREAADRINARLRAKREAGEGGDAEAGELRRAAGAISPSRRRGRAPPREAPRGRRRSAPRRAPSASAAPSATWAVAALPAQVEVAHPGVAARYPPVYGRRRGADLPGPGQRYLLGRQPPGHVAPDQPHRVLEPGLVPVDADPGLAQLGVGERLRPGRRVLAAPPPAAAVAQVNVYTPNLVRIVREGGIPLAFSLSIREHARCGHIAHGIGTTRAARKCATPAASCDLQLLASAHARRPRSRVPSPPRAASRLQPRPAAREQSRDRSRRQSGLFMRMRKTPSKAL